MESDHGRAQIGTPIPRPDDAAHDRAQRSRQRGLDHLLLAVEVVVQRAGARAETGGDGADIEAIESVLGEQR